MSLRPQPSAAEAVPAFGDDEARLNVLLDEYGQLLRRAVARVCPQHLGLEIAEIEQDARIRLWHALRREKDIIDPASYLYRIAATATIDAIRRVKARREEQLEQGDAAEAAGPSHLVEADAPSPERLAMSGEIAAKVQAAIAALPDRRRRAVGLHLKGFSAREIGDLMQWTEAKARNLIYRGLKTLRERLASEGIDCEIE